MEISLCQRIATLMILLDDNVCWSPRETPCRSHLQWVKILIHKIVLVVSELSNIAFFSGKEICLLYQWTCSGRLFEKGVPLELFLKRWGLFTRDKKHGVFGVHSNRWRCSHLTNFCLFIGLNKWWTHLLWNYIYILCTGVTCQQDLMVHSHYPKMRPRQIARPIKMACIELYEGVHTASRPYQWCHWLRHFIGLVISLGVGQYEDTITSI